MTPGGTPIAKGYVDIDIDQVGLEQELDTARRRVDSSFADMNRSGRAAMSAVRAEVEAATKATEGLGSSMRKIRSEMQHVQMTAKQVRDALSSSSVSTSSPGVANGKNSAYGFLLLAQGIEDAQYGFRAVANNIPGVIMAFGGGTESVMKFAGAMTLTATAASIWIGNWKHVQDIVGDTSAFQKARDAFESLTGGIFDSSAITQEMANQQERLQKAANSRAAIEGIGASGYRERGQAFREAVEKYGGGEKLRSDLLRKVIGGRKLSDVDRAKVETGIDIALGNAMSGKTEAKDLGIDRLTKLYQQSTPEAKAMQKEFIEAQKRAMKTSIEAQQKAEKERIDSREDEIAKHVRNMMQGPAGNTLLRDKNANIDEMVKQQLGRVGVSKERIADIGKDVAWDIKKAINDAVKARMEQTGDGDEFARKAILAQRGLLEPMATFTRPKASQVMNGSDVWRAVQTSGMKDFGNDPQLRNLIDINKNIKELVAQGKKGRAGVVANPP